MTYWFERANGTTSKYTGDGMQTTGDNSGTVEIYKNDPVRKQLVAVIVLGPGDSVKGM